MLLHISRTYLIFSYFYLITIKLIEVINWSAFIVSKLTFKSLKFSLILLISFLDFYNKLHCISLKIQSKLTKANFNFKF